MALNIFFEPFKGGDGTPTDIILSRIVDSHPISDFLSQIKKAFSCS